MYLWKKRKETEGRTTRSDRESREDTEQERGGDDCFSTIEVYARSKVHETLKWVTNESIKNGNGSVNTTIPDETEHFSLVTTVVNVSTSPTDQDTGFQSQGETKAMAKNRDDPDQDNEEEFYDSHSNVEELISDAEVHKTDPVIDEEEFYDSHYDIKEPIDDAEMYKSDPVTQIEVELHHGAQDGN